MDDWEKSGCHNREYRHRLSESVNRLTEVSSEKVQHRRDESTGVRDTYPEYEVRNVGTPPDWMALTRLSESAPHLVEPACSSDREEEKTGEEQQEPTSSWWFHHAQHSVIDLRVGYWWVLLSANFVVFLFHTPTFS